MIQIETNGEFFDVFSDTSIGLRLISPAFADEAGDNTHSISFNIPGSAHNQKLLGIYDSPVIYDTPVELAVNLWYDGIVYKKGVIRVKSGSGYPHSYSVSFETDASILAKTIRETKLVDIDLGGQRDIAGMATASEELSLTIDNPSGICALGVNTFPYGINLTPTWTVQDALDEIADRINGDNANNHVDAVVMGSGASATLQLSPSSGFSQLDIDINLQGNQQTWAFISQIGQGAVSHALLIQHMNDVVNAALGTYDYTFVPVYCPEFYAGLNNEYLDHVNIWDWTANTFLANADVLGERWRNTAVPFPRLAYLVQQCVAHLGYTDISTYTSNTEFNQIHFWNNVSLDQDWNGVNYWQTYIDVRDHVPSDMTIADIFNYLRDILNISIDFNYTNKTVDFVPKKDIPYLSAEDWTDISTNQYTFERAQIHDRGFIIEHEKDDNDLYFFIYETSLLKSAKHLNEAKKISCPFPPLPPYNRDHPTESPGGWNIPIIRQVGNTVFPDVEDNGYIFRSFLWKGFTQGSGTANTYPYGTMVNLNTFGGNIGLFSLCLTTLSGISDRGIREEFIDPIWRDENPELTQVVMLDFLQLKNLDYHSPKFLRHKEGDVRGVIKSIEVNLTMTRVGLATVKFHRL